MFKKTTLWLIFRLTWFSPHKKWREKTEKVLEAPVLLLQSLWTGARSVCNNFQVERHVSSKRCASGLKVRFFFFIWCACQRSYPISSDMYINPAVLKRQCICITQRTQQGVQCTTVSTEISFVLHFVRAERTLDICICTKNLWAMVQDFCIGSHQL